MNRLFVVLICAHVLGDFLFQTDWLARNKHRFSVLLLHVAIHGLLAWLVVAQWTLWYLPLMIIAGHGLLDFIKKWVPDTAATFTIDQSLHVALLLGVALLLHYSGITPAIGPFYKPLVWTAGFVAVVLGSGFPVAKVAKRLIDENELSVDGLKSGGRLIGQLERTLIFLLMVIGQPAGIGFLVAAKSILRFEEAKRQQLAEYVLIGTLLSFSLAIALSVATINAVNL
jgi:vacuolar-type H+-ATPase subunit I/STV1